MVAGMMPSLAVALSVSVGEIGYLISWYALGMDIGGPVLTALLFALRIPDKRALLWLLVLYVAGSGQHWQRGHGHRQPALPRRIAEYFRRAGRSRSARSRGVFRAGGPDARTSVQRAGDGPDRAAAWLAYQLLGRGVAVHALHGGGGLRVSVSKGQAQVSLSAELLSQRNSGLWAVYATSALIIGATFTAFSYLSPIFTEVTGFSAQIIPWLLVVYGLANVIGRVADRHTMAVLTVGLGILAMGLGAFALFAHSATISVTAFLVIGLTGVSLNPAMVVRVMRAASLGPLVNTMHALLITVGLAFGSWVGGVAINDGYGLRSPLWIGVALATLGLLSLSPYLRFRHFSVKRTTDVCLGV